MTRTDKRLSTVFAAILSLGILGSGTLVTTRASAQEAGPPAEVIATLTPVYYENVAYYYYQDAWFYRSADGWHRYTGDHFNGVVPGARVYYHYNR